MRAEEYKPIKRHSEPRDDPKRAKESKSYRNKYPQRIKTYLEQWRAEHKEKQREYFRLYYIAHRDELIARAVERKQKLAA